MAGNGYRVNHHYYEDVEFEYIGNVHNFKQEFTKFKEFEETGEVTIVTDVCPGGRRKKLTDNVNVDAMVDTKFAFNLNNDRLKEIFDISEEDNKNEKTVLEQDVDATKKQKIDFGDILGNIKDGSQITIIGDTAEEINPGNEGDNYLKSKYVLEDRPHGYQGNYRSIDEQK